MGVHQIGGQLWKMQHLAYWALYMHSYKMLQVDTRSSSQICHHVRRQGFLHFQTVNWQLSEIQTILSVCPIARADIEGDNLRRCTIVMENECDIIKHFETGEKMIT
jgi:hypothetical protein